MENQPTLGWAKLTYADASDPLWKKGLIEAVERLSGRPQIERLYNEVRFLDVPVRDLWELALRQLQIHLDADLRQLEKIPREGPLVFIGNHPFGVVDGLMLAFLISRVREDHFLLVNEVLTRDPRLSGHLLPIDFRPIPQARVTNVTTGQEALRRMQAGHALGIFPSGGVATSKTFFGPAEDLEWKRFAIKLIQQSRATVVPVFFHGQNSRMFQIVSQFSMPLRLGMLLYETKNKIGKTFRAEIGDPLPYTALEGFSSRDALLEFLRQHTLQLGKPG